MSFIFFLSTPDILPQSKDKITNWPEPVFEHITIADGLPENSVVCMLQDHLGYLWLGTQNGLARYDGYDMTIYQPDPDDSLSINHRIIRLIYEDRTGTMWIVTNLGLNRFDRSTAKFTSYLHNPDDTTSISSNSVKTIYESKKGDLLFGTNKGLNLFNRQTKNFKHIYYKDSVYTSEIGDLIEDRLTGKLYVGSGSKILIFDTEKKILIDDDVITGVKSDFGKINSFYQAGDGTIWIAHSMGLSKFNSLNNNIKLYQPFSSDSDIPNNEIVQLLEDNNGLIWCCIHSTGVYAYKTFYNLIFFNKENEQFRRYWSIPYKQGSLTNNNITSVYKDRSGIIWVGTFYYGFNKWDRNKHRFKRFSNDPNSPNDQRFNRVYTIVEDKKGIIWFGTNNGLYSFNRISNEFHNYKYNAKGKDNTVTYIYKDEDGNIWFGTSTKGLGKFDPITGSFIFYSNDPYDTSTISENIVNCILQGKNNVLWIGTWSKDLNRFNKKTGNFILYKLNPNSTAGINFIYEDQAGKLWIASNLSNGSLRKFDEINKSFSSFLPGEPIYPIYEDRKGNFWVGSYNSGIILFDRDEGVSFYNITQQDGLASNQVRSILEDDSGNLWIGTGNGLSKFDPQTRSTKNYFTSDDYEENRYSLRSACKTSMGEMLFGTDDGFIMFHPDSIKDDPVPPQVVISNVSLFNRQGEKLEYEGFISEVKKLNLSYNENDLRFDYVGLHYGDPSKNLYKHMLEGYDNDWVDAGTQRNAVYTNLDAGEYVFHVTACNLDGVWNEKGASIKIIIPPPFWATWWAYSLYILFGLAALYSIRRYELNRKNLKNQVKLDEVKLKEREETDRMKSRFFANISHEFRTPLTLIKGPAEKLNSNSSGEEIEKQTGVIKRNADRLLGLINQLLDLSKLEAGKLGLKASKSNIVPFIKGLTMSFESVAERKDITLKVKSSSDEVELYFDKEKMTKILTNLLSNAFKFTGEGGQISVIINTPTPRPSKGGDNTFFKVPSHGGRWTPASPPDSTRDLGVGQKIQSANNFVSISVRDTGIGISKEELPKLFDRFYQVDSSQTREHEGTGIGLALTKELVELHKGKISVTSEADKGTEFTVLLPIGKKHLKNEEIFEDEIESTVILNTDFVGMKNLIENNVSDSSPFDKLRVTDSEVSEAKNIVLVVEDNADVREFIKDSLGNDFQIEEASNGEQGVRKTEQIIPDLIISDVMMPKMDGNELTRILKNDEKTSHIPIILLTAKSEQASKLEGLETGADDYLTKPFDTKELQIRINNLINIRKKLQQKFGKTDFVPGKKVEEGPSRNGEAKVGKLSNLEEQFICKVMEVIENHLTEEDFSIEQFGDEVGMGRVQLHRKLKALTGKSPSNYLRSVRLARAKKMIEQKTGSISEIAYSVGFSSPQYFTRSFKEEFGYPPSELAD